MKICLCSDSHGNSQALDEIRKRFPNCDYYLHAGDSEADEYSLSPFKTVEGNCDYAYNLSPRLLINTPYGKLLMQHSPIIPKNIVKKYQVKIFVYGHTHKRCFKQEDGLFIINPGAISFPRDGFDLSFAILDIFADKVDVTFHSLLDK